MARRHLFAIIVVTLSVLRGWAQLDIGMQNEQPQIPTWESYELMQYGKVGATSYTGTVNYSIPIYTYKDKDFEIPVSIDYATNGYRVNHSSGMLGHGWSLSMPGVITRKVNGLPDEKDRVVDFWVAYGNNYKGYQCIPQGFQASASDARPYLTRSGRTIIARQDYGTPLYETEPDLYSFNFLGYSGSFASTPNHQPIASQLFRIFDASGESRGLQIECDMSNSSGATFDITDTKGYIYHFVVAEFYDFEPDNHIAINYVPVTWVLESVKAPNGREVLFKYSRQNIRSPKHRITKKYTYNPRVSFYKGIWRTHTPENPDRNDDVIDSWTSTFRLNEIEFDDGINLRFTYDTIRTEKRYIVGQYGSLSTLDAVCDTNLLRTISLQQNGELLRKFSLNYMNNIPHAHHIQSNCVTFLKSVEISGEGVYTFDYNDVEEVDYPYLGTTQYDHWGYYNAPRQGFPFDSQNLLLLLDYDGQYNEIVNGAFKEPVFESGRMGTLSRITYPTGGFSSLEYESHSYAKQVSRTSSSAFIPHLQYLTENRTAGGVRIKRIINHLSPETPADTTEYIYTTSVEDTLSSGILLNTPRYGIDYTATNYPNGEKHVWFFDISNSMFDYDKTHIEYSDVIEKKSGGGYSKYHYSTSKNYIDHYYVQSGYSFQLETPIKVNYNYSTEVYNVSSDVANILTPVPSKQSMRGKLLEITEYDQDANIRERVTYGYDSVLVGIDTCFHVAGEIARAVYYLRQNTDLVSKKSVQFNYNDSICKEEHYEYDQCGHVTKVSAFSSTGVSLETVNTYVGDTVTDDPVIMQMKSNHELGKILKSEVHRRENGNDVITSALRLTYYLPNNYYVRLACPLMKEEWDGTQWVQTEHYQFDNKGNLVELRREDSLTTTYMWGYGSRNLVAVIDNSTRQQTGAALSHLSLNVGSFLNQTVISDSAFDKLKSIGAYLPHSQQRLWRHKMLVGMIERVNSTNQSEYFRYNQNGKLTSILDTRSHSLEQYDYHNITEPVTSE